MTDFIDINRKLWNDKVAYHVASEFYNQEAFLNGLNSLKRIELDILGDVSGKDILHLQCHFGQDSISLTRMGANVTGVDFSDKAIDTANQITKDLGLNTNFVCCNVYDTADFIKEQFDIVFTSYGTIGWLPDLKPWSEVISKMLKPGGRLVFVEFHPFLWSMDENFDFIKYHYFNKEEIVEIVDGTYADKNAEIHNQSINWNHPLSDVMQNLINAGLQISLFKEYDYSPYTCFNRLVKVGDDAYQIEGLEGKLPMVYSIEAVKV